ncbi:hypothetical protein Dda_9279 [Drechslerella dactyloides]|uniref:Zn(2)-C6 fungal-type domain-containing protein n=1 Tax=Drechslerella dactyloides TaxID=74499 RepID=A0AAD6NF73_DREDA|nr:hypothetical protein Dda_9279 [Drechslerella dactyloides]
MPPKNNTLCWRCRRDHQACLRDPNNPEGRCERCASLGYTCAIEQPEQWEGRTLNFMKCDQCRRDRQKCEPKGSDWPERCNRCVRKGLPCSPRSQTKGLPRRKRESGNAPDSGSGGPSDSYGGDDQGGDDVQEYEYYEGDEAGYPLEYGQGNYQYGAYGHDAYDTYQNYTGYDQQQYGQDAYGQPLVYSQTQYSYNY